MLSIHQPFNREVMMNIYRLEQPWYICKCNSCLLLYTCNHELPKIK